MPPPHISSLAPSPSSFPAPCLPPSSPPPSLHTPSPFSSPTPSYSPAQVLFRCLLGPHPLSTFRHRSSPVPDAPSLSTFPALCLPPSSPPPSLHSKSPLSSPAPSYSPAPVLFRCLLGPRPFSTFRHRPSPVPDAPSFFNIIRLNRTERRSFIRSDLSGRTKWPLFGQIGPNRGSLFGPVWPNEKLVLGRGKR